MVFFLQYFIVIYLFSILDKFVLGLYFLDSSSSTEVTDDYDTDFVRQSLRKYGYHPGPLLPSTKHVYVRKLNEILKSQSKFQHKKHSINLDGIFYNDCASYNIVNYTIFSY